MEKTTVESASEKIKTKAEIDQQINDLETEIQILSQKRSDLKSHLESLIHKYEQGGQGLESFKKAKELLEKRIESPTMSDKLKQRFSSLFGGDGIIEDKIDFLEKRSGVKESVEYKEEGEDLRETVSEIAEEKDALRGLMGEDLSFRGGTVEGEEKAPREESIEKISETIESIDEDIKTKSEEIAPMRDEAYEAWKRENPEEYQALENKKAMENESQEKLSLLKEFMETKPSNEAIFDVCVSILKNSKTKSFSDELVSYVKELYLNRVAERFYLWFQYDKGVFDIDDDFTEKILQRYMVNSYVELNNISFLFDGKGKDVSKLDVFRAHCLNSENNRTKETAILIRDLSNKNVKDIYEYMSNHQDYLKSLKSFLKYFYYKKGIKFDDDSKFIEKFTSELVDVQGTDFLKEGASQYFTIDNESGKVDFHPSGTKVKMLGFELSNSSGYDSLTKAIVEAITSDIDFSQIYNWMDNDILSPLSWNDFVDKRLSSLNYIANKRTLYANNKMDDLIRERSSEILTQLKTKFDEKVTALKFKQQDLKDKLQS